MLPGVKRIRLKTIASGGGSDPPWVILFSASLRLSRRSDRQTAPVDSPVWSGGSEDPIHSSWEHTRSIRDSLRCPKAAHTPPAESEKKSFVLSGYLDIRYFYHDGDHISN